MKTLPNKHEAQAGKRGFTLTEIAIVLGIIGLILGAIWVAAAAVYNNMRVSQASTELLQIAQAVRSMYATSTTVDPAANMPQAGAAAGPALTYIRAGVFPANMLNGGPAVATQAIGPWGGNVSVLSANSPTGVPNDSFAVRFNEVPTPACIDLLVSQTGTGRDPGMYNADGAAAGANPAGVNALPMLATTARTQCAGLAGNTNAIAFYFTLRAS